MGLYNTVLQFVEHTLEYGPWTTLLRCVPMVPHQMIFFIFQNKTIASAVKGGMVTGVAKYNFTGRPHANKHQSWKENYVLYYTMHYYPAIRVMSLYVIYNSLLAYDNSAGLPMYLIVSSAVGWLICPVLYSPQPRLASLGKDMREFWHFVHTLPSHQVAAGQYTGHGGGGLWGISDNTLYGVWLTKEMEHTKGGFLYRVCCLCVASGAFAVCMLTMHAQILDYVWGYCLFLTVHWALMWLWRLTGSTVVWFALLLGWPIMPFLLPKLVPEATDGCGTLCVTEFFISAFIFMELMNFLKQVGYMLGYFVLRPPAYKKWVDVLYVNLLQYHRHLYAAVFIIIVHLIVTLVLIMFEILGGFHSWFLLNRNLRGGLLGPCLGVRGTGGRASGNNHGSWMLENGSFLSWTRRQREARHVSSMPHPRSRQEMPLATTPESELQIR